MATMSHPMKPDEPIVLSIFGSERCVTTLGDLEAVTTAIHSKAVRERDHPSTFAEKLEGQICPINDSSDAKGAA